MRPDQWKVVERSPVLFRRTALTGALPMPERGGTLAELRDVLNVTNESWPLIVGWLVAALIPNIPHPVLLLSGLQGTGKSFAARVLVLLFDPSPAPLRSEPRNMDDWQVAASGSWAVCLDNLSGIPPWVADAICRAATGDGLVKRKNYSDSDLTILSFRRVVLLTTIDAGALRGDLGERLLLVDLEPIPEAGRRTEKELDALFAERQPRLFGSLLDALAAVLAKLPDVHPARLPRMADFGHVLAAAEAAGVIYGAFDQFRAVQGRIAAEVLDADPFGTALVEFVHVRRSEWHGTATALLAALLGGKTEKLPHGWPKMNGVKGRLMRLTPALAAQGVSVLIPPSRTNKGRVFKLERTGNGSSRSSLPHENGHQIHDDGDNPPAHSDDPDGASDDAGGPIGTPSKSEIPINNSPRDACDDRDDVLRQPSNTANVAGDRKLAKGS